MATRGRLRAGSNVSLGARARFLAPAYMELGDNVSFGSDIHVEANLRIGSDVLISSCVAVIGNDHRFDDVDGSVFWGGRLPDCEVVIEGDNLIGFGVVVVGPVRIARGCIVGAGSVVTRDLPEDSVCVGSPARPIRARRRLHQPTPIGDDERPTVPRPQ
jgi:maltose O-acetyltransferase